MPNITALRFRADAPTLSYSQQKRWLTEFLVLAKTDFGTRVDPQELAGVIIYLAAKMWERDDLRPVVRKRLKETLDSIEFPLATFKLDVPAGYNPLIIAFSPSGQYVAAGTYLSPVQLIDIASRQVMREFPGDVTRLTFSPDGRYLLTGNGEIARLWEVNTGEELRQFVGHEYAIFGLAFSPDGQFIATCTCGGSPDPTARIWDVNTGEELRRFEDHPDRGIFSVAFSKDSNYIMTGHQAVARMWDRATGEHIRQIDAPDSNFDSIEFSRDGKYILTANHLAALLWKADTGEFVRRFQGEHIVNNARFSSDDKSILTVGSDGARLWDVATGNPQKTFRWPTDYVYSAALSQDNQYVLTSSSGGPVRLWRV